MMLFVYTFAAIITSLVTIENKLSLHSLVLLPTMHLCTLTEMYNRIEHGNTGIIALDAKKQNIT